MADIIRKYTPQECEAYRQIALEQRVLPYIEASFQAFPEFNSAIAMLLEMFNDEYSYIDCYFGFFHSAPDEIYRTEKDFTKLDFDSTSIKFIPKDSQATTLMWDNKEAFPHFASQIVESGDGWCMSPYALFTRSVGGAVTEVIGTMQRPHLDGVDDNDL